METTVSNIGKGNKNENFDIRIVLPLVSVIFALFVHLFVPNSEKYIQKPLNYYINFLIAFGIVYTVLIIISVRNINLRNKLAYKSWFIAVGILVLNIYNITTLKLQLIPLLFFPPPEKILSVYAVDWQFILQCFAHSSRLLGIGFIVGALTGITTGVCIGWSRKFNYWIMPVVKILGPIPSTAWIPIVLVAFPTTFSGSVFLIALSVWFPTTVLTSSGVSSVRVAYFEVASTLGANTFENIFKIAIPAAMPNMFIGLFNGTTASFITLMTAEMLGVKFGIGWYINWQREVMAYANVYAGLIAIAVTCSLLITILFKFRDKVLVWQKGTIKW